MYYFSTPTDLKKDASIVKIVNRSPETFNDNDGVISLLLYYSDRVDIGSIKLAFNKANYSSEDIRERLAKKLNVYMVNVGNDGKVIDFNILEEKHLVLI
jgi:hypothetical protein